MSASVSEFDEEYERHLTEAQRRARTQGRSDVADYLSVRSANDALRSRGVEQLFDVFTTQAGEMNRVGVGIAFTRTDPHRFSVGSSSMVGARIVFSRGMRSLTVEAGWPRAPRDGIVRGGGLACARLTHFGDPRAGCDLLLALAPGGAARWFSVEDSGARTELGEQRIRTHLFKLTE